MTIKKILVHEAASNSDDVFDKEIKRSGQIYTTLGVFSTPSHRNRSARRGVMPRR